MFFLWRCFLSVLRTVTPTGCSVDWRWEDDSSCWTWRRTSESDSQFDIKHNMNIKSLTCRFSAATCCPNRPTSSTTCPTAPACLWEPTLWWVSERTAVCPHTVSVVSSSCDRCLCVCVQTHCYYHGSVRGFPQSRVALSTCSGLRSVTSTSTPTTEH